MQTKKLKKIALISSLATALFTINACTTTNDYAKQVDSNANVKEIKDLKKLDINGKFALINYQNKTGANFYYEKFYDFENVKILSPLGNNLATLNISKNHAELITTNAKHIGKSGSELLNNVLGIEIPVDNLFSIFVANLSNIQRDNNGFVKEGFIGPYKVQYKSYRKVKNFMIPSSLEVTDGKGLMLKILNNNIKI